MKRHTDSNRLTYLPSMKWCICKITSDTIARPKLRISKWGCSGLWRETTSTTHGAIQQRWRVILLQAWNNSHTTFDIVLLQSVSVHPILTAGFTNVTKTAHSCKRSLTDEKWQELRNFVKLQAAGTVPKRLKRVLESFLKYKLTTITPRSPRASCMQLSFLFLFLQTQINTKHPGENFWFSHLFNKIINSNKYATWGKSYVKKIPDTS